MTIKEFKAYVGDPDFHDGIIRRVWHESDLLFVELEGYSGARHVVRFTGVESVVSHAPEGMVVYALDEMDTQPPLREFVFANSKEHDELGGDSKLEVTAHGVAFDRL